VRGGKDRRGSGARWRGAFLKKTRISLSRKKSDSVSDSIMGYLNVQNMDG